MKYRWTDPTDKREYTLKLKKVNNKFQSQYHEKAYMLIKKMYTLYPMYEETKLCGTKNDLYLDLFIPSLKIAIEVQGQQHYKFIPHFHQNIIGYARAKSRDQEKALWCEINEITLIELIYNETEEEWKSKLSLQTKK